MNRKNKLLYFWRTRRLSTTLAVPLLYLATQPLLIGDSTTSSSTPGSLLVSELLLRTTLGPSPDRCPSGPTEGADWMLGAVGLTGSLLKSLLVHLPFRLSEEATCLTWPSSGRQAATEEWTPGLYVRFISIKTRGSGLTQVSSLLRAGRPLLDTYRHCRNNCASVHLKLDYSLNQDCHILIRLF